MNYSDQYLKSFYKGLKSTEFSGNSRIISSDKFIDDISKLINPNTRLFFYGNGASMAFANHMALDWSKNAKVSSCSLSSSALLTALVNDYSKDEMFSKHLEIEKLTQKDLVITISSSGNSSNIVSAIEFANNLGATTISFSGLNKENQSKITSNFSCFVPLMTYGQVECAHQYWLHLWLDYFLGIEEWNRNESQNMNDQKFVK